MKPLSETIERLRQELEKLDPQITEARTELRRVLGDELLGVEGAAKRKKPVRKRLDDLVEQRTDLELQIAEIEYRIELLAERERQQQVEQKRTEAINAGHALLKAIAREADAFDALAAAQAARHAAVRPFYGLTHDVLGKAVKQLYDDPVELVRQRPSVLSWRDVQTNRVNTLLRELGNGVNAVPDELKDA